MTDLPKQRIQAGKALRTRLPRSEHARVPSFARDPIALLEASNEGRLPQLIPIRYGRMLASPFAFYRGAASVMAHDLASTAATGLRVQLCGDCHLMNFGTYGTPERNLVFDINDFDETLPGPWEWDVKRLATSFVIAARYKGFSAAAQRRATEIVVRTYRLMLADFAAMSPLDVWYSRITSEDVIRLSPSAQGRKLPETARKHNAASLLPKLCESVDGTLRLKDDPPLLYHPQPSAALLAEMPHFFEAYKQSLHDNRRALLNRYHVADVAYKVVGVGSVGTRCLAALLLSREQQPLVLQLKEARASVLAEHAGHSLYDHHGRRVVEGQRLMQAATDLFLGWARTEKTGLDFYVRQMRDWKGSLDLEGMQRPVVLEEYAELCGWALARAHARAGGQAAELSGYLGTRPNFDRALVDFACAYADQNEKDFAALKAAEKSGRIHAQVQPDA